MSRKRFQEVTADRKRRGAIKAEKRRKRLAGKAARKLNR